VWHREHRRWRSPALRRDMDLLIFGHAGARVLVFPTSMGRFFEWEDREMVAAVGDMLRNGWLQLFCVDSVDAESWYNRSVHPGAGAWRHIEYERYLIDEVLPLTRSLNANPFLITTGASFGAYHALNFAFRHPHLVGRTLGLSGLYDIKQITRGYSDDTVWANDPSRYVSHRDDHGWVEAMRRLDIIFTSGRDDPSFGNNEYLSGALWSRSIGHAFRPWDGWAHDWPWWRQMLRLYIGGHD
jgi:esterase/lipase superfamily enzyme